MDKMEETPTDHDDKPEKDIKINSIIIFVDPFDVIRLYIVPLTYRNGRRNGERRNLMMNKKNGKRRH